MCIEGVVKPQPHCLITLSLQMLIKLSSNLSNVHIFNDKYIKYNPHWKTYNWSKEVYNYRLQL